MTELPSGTVSLLFSDVEGSTALLSRLRLTYAEALAGQRKVLRKAWVDHGGTELGTEGDSFFVVFPTAHGAVGAAAQAQRDLAAFEWPAGEQVRVRMGIHTGTPQVHDGGYVGMDVHRGARIAGAAYGGQVVLSEATAGLVGGCLPERVRLRDLGKHQLKDIASPEHVFQLVIEGLRSDFAPLKSLGAVSSLPRPPTPLVGRDGEVAKLIASMGSPDVRLVTLTGPGGSGKTRLAIALAQELVEWFPDGVFYVALSTVTTSDVMWTGIAEVLDVPAEERIPPAFFQHVAHRTALFVLDNLEQIEGADTVVSELLHHAPQAIAIATSRKPLAVPAEHVHPVPPLELPEGAGLTQAEASGAVQLFVKHAQKVKPAFRLTSDNAREVVEVCRRLDGLPLAMELAAARVRLLSPKALLSRLDQALDLAATDKHGPARQQTLRNTIAWSYDLLNPTQQAFFCHLGVFSGGADLDAITTVTADNLNAEHVFLDLVADLMDASLVSIVEDLDGEPRVHTLGTVRTYAVEQLKASGQLEAVRRRHATHYLAVVRRLRPLTWGSSDQILQARNSFELDVDNIRGALAWSLGTGEDTVPSPKQTRIGLCLCADLSELWVSGGYFAEGRRWLGRAIDLADARDSPEFGRCLTGSAVVAIAAGDATAAQLAAAHSVQWWRSQGDKEELSYALARLGRSELFLGNQAASRAALEEALKLADETGNKDVLADTYSKLAQLETIEHNFVRSIGLLTEAVANRRELGDRGALLADNHSIGCALLAMGRVEEAHRRMSAQIPEMVRVAPPHLLVAAAEDYAAVLAEVGDHLTAARLLGATDAMRERLAIPRLSVKQSDITKPIARARAALTAQEWDDAYQTGRNTTVADSLIQAHSTSGG